MKKHVEKPGVIFLFGIVVFSCSKDDMDSELPGDLQIKSKEELFSNMPADIHPLKAPIQIRFLDIALELPDKSPRDLAWHITDSYGYNISGSSVYRILKSYDLIMSPAYIVISAADHFKQPMKRVHEL